MHGYLVIVAAKRLYLLADVQVPDECVKGKGGGKGKIDEGINKGTRNAEGVSLPCVCMW